MTKTNNFVQKQERNRESFNQMDRDEEQAAFFSYSPRRYKDRQRAGEVLNPRGTTMLGTIRPPGKEILLPVAKRYEWEVNTKTGTPSIIADGEICYPFQPTGSLYFDWRIRLKKPRLNVRTTKSITLKVIPRDR